MKKIHFIVNPIAGSGKTALTKELLDQFFVNSQHHLTIKCSTYKNHAIALTKNSIAEGADIIVACGGDGTINEVASCLLETNIPLGIVPMGSGNGLASNLGISKNLRRALSTIKSQHIIRIDTGNINGNHFFSNTGVGFDARVIKNYESSEKRTLIGYLKACLLSFKETGANLNFEISLNDVKLTIDPFLIFISNSNEMGYKFSLTPKASLKDGLLDVMIISKIGRWKMLWLGILVIFNRPYLLKEAKTFQTRHLKLRSTDQTYFDFQIDGELRKIDDKNINITIEDGMLQVIVPKTESFQTKSRKITAL